MTTSIINRFNKNGFPINILSPTIAILSRLIISHVCNYIFDAIGTITDFKKSFKIVSRGNKLKKIIWK